MLYKSAMMGVISGTGTTYPSEAAEFIIGFNGVRVVQVLDPCPLAYCFSFYLKLLINPLISSNFSYIGWRGMELVV